MTCVPQLLTKEEFDQATYESTSGDSAQYDWLETWRVPIFGHIAALEREAAKVPEVVRVAEAHGWNGVDNAKHLATFLEDELAALAKLRAQQVPPTPEEVARLESQVRAAITGNVGADATWEAGTALSRLAAQAARVPGLVARVDAAMKSVALHEDQIAVLLEQVRAAESERDAAQKDRDEAKRMAEDQEALVEAWSDALGLAKTAGYDEADAIREERDSLRERVATLERELSELNGEAQRINEMHDTAESRVRELEARAGKLEADNRVLESHRDTMQVERNRALDYQKVLRERFDTTRNDALEEAAVRVDTEAQESHTREIASVLDDVARRIRALKIQPSFPTASQPPPAPAQGVKCPACEGRGYPGEIGVGRGGQGSCPDCKGSGREPSPTPPPGLLDLLGNFLSTLASTPRNPYPTENDPRAAGWADALDAVREGANALTGALNAARASRVPAPPGLREAVGKAFAPLRDPAQFGHVLSTDPDALAASMGIPGVQWDRLLTWLESRILAAYDATGGEHPDTAALRDLRADVARVLEMARLGVHVGDTATEVGEKAVQAVRALHDDAAKYRAAVERSSNRAALLSRLAADGLSEHDAQRARATCLAYLLSGPPPRETLDKAQVAEVLTRWRDASATGAARHADDGSLSAFHKGARRAAYSIAYALGLTLATPPSGPGGGEECKAHPGKKCDPETPGVYECRVTDSSGRLLASQPITTRARIAPPPTPEVPPQPSTPAVVLERDGIPPCGGCGVHMCPGCSSISTVVWSGSGVEVFIDGAVAALVVGGKPDWTQTAVTLARALAEAKLDARLARASLASSEEALRQTDRALAEAKREVAEAACQAIRRFASRLGDDATGHDTDRSLEELEVALYQHVMDEEDKARAHTAEEMREQAALACDETANDTAAPNSIREVARLLARLIRALPLLGKAVRRG